MSLRNIKQTVLRAGAIASATLMLSGCPSGPDIQAEGKGVAEVATEIAKQDRVQGIIGYFRNLIANATTSDQYTIRPVYAEGAITGDMPVSLTLTDKDLCDEYNVESLIITRVAAKKGAADNLANSSWHINALGFCDSGTLAQFDIAVTGNTTHGVVSNLRSFIERYRRL